jgi:hypothetical protein
MLKKVTFVAAIAAASLLMSSCSIVTPLAATSNPIGKKIGTAKAKIILGLYFGADHSILKACQNGGITKISTVDVKYKNILGIIMIRETIVSGE